MIRFLTLFLTLILSAATAAAVVTAPAHGKPVEQAAAQVDASYSPTTDPAAFLRWALPVLCVNDLTQNEWPIAEAVARADTAYNVSVVYKPGCEGYEQQVRVYDGDWFTEYGYTWLGLAVIDLNGDGAPDQAFPESGRIWTAWIYLNNERRHIHKDGSPRSEEEVTGTVVHEIGHALGAHHETRPDSVMKQTGVLRLVFAPTPYDIELMNRRYAAFWWQPDSLRCT